MAILNCCSQEELEAEEEEELISPTPPDGEKPEDPVDGAERRRVIKSKILAVGRMSRVFSLLRYVFDLCLFHARGTELVVREFL